MGGRENMQIDRNFKIWLGFWTWWGWCDILFINILGIDLRGLLKEGLELDIVQIVYDCTT